MEVLQFRLESGSTGKIQRGSACSGDGWSIRNSRDWWRAA